MVWSTCASAGSGGNADLSLSLSAALLSAAFLSAAAGLSGEGLSACAKAGKTAKLRQPRAQTSRAARERECKIRGKFMSITIHAYGKQCSGADAASFTLKTA